MVALVTFLHGLPVSEWINLRWDDIDWRKGTIAVRRLKGSMRQAPTTSNADEAIYLETTAARAGHPHPHIFTSERRQAFPAHDLPSTEMIGAPRAEGTQVHMASASALFAAPSRARSRPWRHGCPGDYGSLMGHGLRITNTPNTYRVEPGTIEGCLAGKALTSTHGTP